MGQYAGKYPSPPEFRRNHEQLIPGGNVDTAWGTRLTHYRTSEKGY